MIRIKHYKTLSKKELYTLLQLRNEVFVVEQNCPYQDIDDLDQDSFHGFYIEHGQMIAYARLIKPGHVYANSPAIGRVCVKKKDRHKGYAKALMVALIAHAFKTYTCQTITLSAQAYLIDFYQDLGFKIQGNEYLEDEIPHIKMTLTKK